VYYQILLRDKKEVVDMLKLTKKEKKITIETVSGKLTWDADRGGEIVEFSCKNEK
jgi:hypothetical protein